MVIKALDYKVENIGATYKGLFPSYLFIFYLIRSKQKYEWLL